MKRAWASAKKMLAAWFVPIKPHGHRRGRHTRGRKTRVAVVLTVALSAGLVSSAQPATAAADSDLARRHAALTEERDAIRTLLPLLSSWALTAQALADSGALPEDNYASAATARRRLSAEHARLPQIEAEIAQIEEVLGGAPDPAPVRPCRPRCLD